MTEIKPAHDELSSCARPGSGSGRAIREAMTSIKAGGGGVARVPPKLELAPTAAMMPRFTLEFAAFGAGPTLRSVLRGLGLALLLIGAFAAPGRSASVTAHVFWRTGCPHCANARAVLGELESQVEELRVEETELGVSPEDDALFLKLLALLEVENPAVPFVTIGNRYVIGFATGGVTRQVYRDLVDRCRTNACPDLVAELRRLSALATGHGPPADGAPEGVAPTTVTIPLLGAIELAALSLPMLTIVLAGIDGFNPCAMWVLVLLIGMLLGVADARRMWTLGLVFLLAIGAMYFAVMATWLNMVLWVGAVIWLRIAIAALAVGAGLHYLRDYWTNPEPVCRVGLPPFGGPVQI
jgi:glutaredoxin